MQRSGFLFEIRHQISDLEEEIYCLEARSNTIAYRGFYISKRRNINEPFGYDWREHYRKTIDLEIDALEKQFSEEIHEWNHPEHNLIKEIENKYNPCLQGLLKGIFSNEVSKLHPLKISEEFIKNALIEEIKQMKLSQALDSCCFENQAR